MDVALEELNEAVKIDPNNARIYNIYGLVYTQLGENPKAEENFRRGLALAPDDSEIRQNWGWYLCQTGRPRESIAEFEAAVRNPLYKTPWIALINAGKCSAASGDAVAAQGFYRRALTASPNNPEAAYNFALLQYKSGELRRLARADADRHAAVQPAARSAVSRPVHRAQARRPSVRAVVRDAAAQPLARRRGDPGDCRGNLRVTDSDVTRAAGDGAPRAGSDTAPQSATGLAADATAGIAAAGAATAGAMLAAARARAGLSIDAVAQQLKLGVRQVQAIEEDNFAALPGRTFVRGFVRNYARLLKLDGDAVLAALPGSSARRRSRRRRCTKPRPRSANCRPAAAIGRAGPAGPSR